MHSIYDSQEAAPPTLPALNSSGGPYAAGPSTTTTAAAAGAAGTASNPQGAGAPQANSIDASLFTIVDPDIARENPVEAKHRRLVRSHRSGPLDRELKPNAAVRDELNVSVANLSRFRSECANPTNYVLTTGDPFLPTDTCLDINRDGPRLVVPLLPNTRSKRSDQIPQIGRLVRPGRGQASYRGASADVDRTCA